MDNQVIVYDNGEIELKVSADSETIWANTKEIADIFNVDRSVVSRHIKNIFKDHELDEKVVCAKFAHTTRHGALNKKTQTRMLDYYNLDIILAVGYRTNSSKAIEFRKWATKVLKQYIYNGYTINSEKITHQRFKELENDVNSLKHKVSKIENLTNTNELDIKQGIFFNGEIFDAHNFVSDLIRGAKNSIILIDNYIDDSTLLLFSKNQNIDVTIYTHTFSKALKLDLEKYNKQYRDITIKTNKNFHDRFLIIDEKEVYHMGASLKDLGKKAFAFSKMNDLVQHLLKHI